MITVDPELAALVAEANRTIAAERVPVPPPPRPPAPTQCARCAGPLAPLRYPGRPRKWCSEACRVAAWRAAHDHPTA